MNIEVRYQFANLFRSEFANLLHKVADHNFEITTPQAIAIGVHESLRGAITLLASSARFALLDDQIEEIINKLVVQLPAIMDEVIKGGAL